MVGSPLSHIVCEQCETIGLMASYAWLQMKCLLWGCTLLDCVFSYGCISSISGTALFSLLDEGLIV